MKKVTSPLPTYIHYCIPLSLMFYVITISACMYMYTPPDPTWTTENVIGVMEKVTDGGAMVVWRKLINEDLLEDINSKCSTERELVHTCADIYVNCYPNSSWEGVALGLYRIQETAAVEEVRSYLNPRGRFCQWVWFVVNNR